MRRTARFIVVSAGLSTLLGACDLSVDPSLIGRDDAGDDSPMMVPDATPSPIEPSSDASTPTAPDATAADAGADADAAPQCDPFLSDCYPTLPDATVPLPPCSADSQCGADAFCAANKTCQPRCDDVRGCVGPAVAAVGERMLQDAQWIYYSTLNGKDGAGNSLQTGAIWRWNGKDEPQVITSGISDPTLLQLSEGKLYYRTGGDEIVRINITPGAAAEPLLPAKTGAFWMTASHFYWVVGLVEGNEVWRRPRTGSAADEKVLTSSNPFRDWWVGTNSFVLSETYASPATQLVLTPLDGTASKVLGVTGAAGFGRMKIEGSYLLTSEMCLLRRYDLTSGAAKNLANAQTGSEFCSRWVADWQGDWITYKVLRYTNQQAELVLGRTHVDLTVAPTVLTKIPVPVTAWDNTPLVASRDGRTVTYANPIEQRLFTLTAPGYPCSDTLACPTGLVCRADNLCR